MAQIINIECSNCESVDKYETEGFVLFGLIDGKLFMVRHEMSFGDVVDDFLDKFLDKSGGENGLSR